MNSEKNDSGGIENKQKNNIKENQKDKINEIKLIKKPTFKNVSKPFDKKMDKKIVQDIQLIIKDFLKNGELKNSELENPEKIMEVKSVIVEMLKNMIEKKGDLEIFSKYEECIIRYLNDSITIQSPTYDSEKVNNLTNQIIELKKIPQPEQRTPEWYTFRNNRLTASDLGTIIGVNPYEQYNTILLKKCGIEKPFFMNKNILRGVKYEEVICKIYEYRNEVKVFEYGCIPHPTIGHFGASPDGIVDFESKNKNYIGRMLEIKCPGSRPITGFIPEYYHAQVQGQLEVCDLEYCDFVECKIDEYKSDDDYFNDYYKLDETKKYHLQENGLEKGVVIETYDKSLGKNVFYYSEIGMSRKQIKEWENECFDKILENDNMEYLTTTYWKATEYNELLIKRNKEWWEKECVPKIDKFWEDVLKYRKRPIDEVKEILMPSKKPKPEKNQKGEMEKFVNIKVENSNSNSNSTSDNKKEEENVNKYIFISDSESD